MVGVAQSQCPEHLKRSESPIDKIAVTFPSLLNELGHSVISRTIQNQDTGLLVTGNSREAILATESECPVLRLATPAVSAASMTQPARIRERDERGRRPRRGNLLQSWLFAPFGSRRPNDPPYLAFFPYPGIVAGRNPSRGCCSHGRDHARNPIPITAE